MDKHIRKISLFLAVLIFTIFLPLEDIIVYGEDLEGGTQVGPIESVDFNVTLNKGNFDLKDARINALIKGNNIASLVEDGSYFGMEIKEVSPNELKVENIPISSLDEEIGIIEGLNLKIFDEIDKLPKVTTVGYLASGGVEILGSNFGKVKDESIGLNLYNPEFKENIKILGDEIKSDNRIETNRIESHLGNWDLVILESRQDKGVDIKSRITYKEVLGIDRKNLGLEITSVNPDKLDGLGGDLRLKGKNILDFKESINKGYTDREIEPKGKNMLVKYKSGTYGLGGEEERKYSTLTREIKFFLDGRAIDFEYLKKSDEFILTIPAYVDGESLDRDISVSVNTKLKYEDDSSEDFYEIAKLEGGFSYDIPSLDLALESVDFDVTFNKGKFDLKDARINALIKGNNIASLVENGSYFGMEIKEVSPDELKVENIPISSLDEEIGIIEGLDLKIFDRPLEVTQADYLGGGRARVEGKNLDQLIDNMRGSFYNHTLDEIKRVDSSDIGKGGEDSIILTDKFKDSFGLWDFIIEEEREEEGVRVRSKITYKGLIEIKDKKLGMEIDTIDPDKSGLEGLKEAKITGSNIKNLGLIYNSKRTPKDVSIFATKINLTYEDGRFDKRDYKTLTREVEFSIGDRPLIVLDILDGLNQDEFTVEIPRCDDAEHLKRDIKVTAKTKIVFPDGKKIEFSEEAVLKNGFTYEVLEEEKLVVDSISSKTILMKYGKNIIISGKNFLPKDEIEIFLDGRKLSTDYYKVNDEGTRIVCQLPPLSEPGLKEFKIKSKERGAWSTYLEYVDKYTSLETIKGAYIYNKPVNDGGDYGKNNRFLISSFDIDKDSIPTNNLVLKIKAEDPIDQDFLNEKIEGLRLVRKSDKKTIILKKGKIIGDGGSKLSRKDKEPLKNETFQLESGDLYIYLSEEVLKELARGSEAGDYENMPTAAGVYDVYLDVKGGQKLLKLEHIDDTDKKVYESLVIKDKPWVEQTVPRMGEPKYNANEMYEEFINGDGTKETGYYIKVRYNNQGNLSLVRKDGSHRGISIKVLGDAENLVDYNKKLRLKDSTLYIPLREKLEDGKAYTVNIPANEYLEYPEYDSGDETQNKKYFRNKGYSWKFGTKAVPVIDQVFEGSVVENYDYNYPIVLEGYSFYSDSEVAFRDSGGKTYYADDVRYYKMDDGVNRLYIYLPRGRDRLRVGSYTIIIINGSDHKSEMEYGNFSVVKEGREVPREDYTIKDDKFYGDVISYKKQSEDTLELRESNRNRYDLRIDLDQLMGDDTWTRSIEYPVDYSDRIDSLRLESKWGDIIINNLRLSSFNESRRIKLRVGRAAPGIIGSLRSKLSAYDIKSDFIEVEGENFDFDSVTVDLPYRNSDGGGLELMEYDKLTRTFNPIPSTVDKLEGRVRGTSSYPGIFVVVGKEW